MSCQLGLLLFPAILYPRSVEAPHNTDRNFSSASRTRRDQKNKNKKTTQWPLKPWRLPEFYLAEGSMAEEAQQGKEEEEDEGKRTQRACEVEVS
jgi:predicted acyl esterase